LDKEDFDFRIALAKLQSDTAILNGGAISMLGASFGTAIATIGLGGILNFNQHPVEFSSLFFMTVLLVGAGSLLFRSSSKTFHKRVAALEEKFTRKEHPSTRPNQLSN